jgi:RNA polymerase sporulation-specific sigma factor
MRRLLAKIRLWVCRLRLKFSFGGAYYVTGVELLPPPMTPEEEADVLEHIDEYPDAAEAVGERNLCPSLYFAQKIREQGVGS